MHLPKEEEEEGKKMERQIREKMRRGDTDTRKNRDQDMIGDTTFAVSYVDYFLHIYDSYFDALSQPNT